MAKLTSFLGAVLMTMTSLVGQATGKTKATELLAQARAALGGEAALAKVRGLSIAGTVQRLLGDRQLAGELTIDLQLPDKMIRSDSMSPMGDGALIITDQGINGEKLLRNTRTVNVPPGAVLRMPPAPAAGSEAEAQALKNSRAEMGRLTVALLLTAPSSLPLEFAYEGEAEAPDGKADVIRVDGPNSFVAQLFLDKSTHRPLMLTYKGVAPQIRIQTRQGRRSPDAAQADSRAEGASNAAGSPPQVVDINMFLEDYKLVDGILLPHRVIRSIDGQTNEEWTLQAIKINPAFKPETFSGK